jgi:hypothetical protein
MAKNSDLVIDPRDDTARDGRQNPSRDDPNSVPVHDSLPFARANLDGEHLFVEIGADRHSHVPATCPRTDWAL